MKYFLEILVIQFLLITFSCKKNQNLDPEPPIITNELIVIWDYDYPNALFAYGGINPIIFENDVISSYQSIINPQENEVIISHNKLSGAENWSWNNYIRPIPQKVRGTNRIYNKNNTLFACSSQDNYSIDMISGETNWATNNDEGNPRTSQWEDLIFHTETYGEAPYGDSSNVLMRNIENGNWEKKFGVLKSGVFEVNLETPGVFIDQNGDTLLIFQNRQVEISPPYPERVDLYCYNLSQDSIVWFKANLTPSGSSHVQTPLVEGDFVYFGGKWDFYCIDIVSGEIIWTHNFYWDYQLSNFLIYDDLIITNLDNGDLIAIDKITGDQVWVNEGLSGCCTELSIFDGRIYFGNLNLYVVNADSGNLIYKFKSPNQGGEFRNGVVVDLINKKMYTSDQHHLYCFELPE